ncbi:MAG: hypothetical protein H0Z39_08695 [Peptococcaceae bacterium]|nr:hypothetical protein [Peptococcaceae bacterium]
MRKPILLLLCLVLLAAGVIGCRSTSDFEAYRQAVNKTENINSAHVLTKFKMHMDFDSADLTAEARQNLAMFSEISGTLVEKFDRAKQISYVDGHIDVPGMGVDFKIYANKDQIIVLLPMFTRYLVIDKDDANPAGTQNQHKTEAAEQEDPAFSGLETKLRNIWNNVIREDNVKRTGEKLITTPEGDIRVTRYDITLTDAEIKKIARQTVTAVLSDEAIRRHIIANWRRYTTSSRDEQPTAPEIEAHLDKLLASCVEGINQAHYESFTVTGMVDRDGYLVQKNVRFKVTAGDREHFTMRMDMDIQLQRWNIEKDISIDFPPITPENSFPARDFRKHTPQLWEGFWDQKFWEGFSEAK